MEARAPNTGPPESAKPADAGRQAGSQGTHQQATDGNHHSIQIADAAANITFVKRILRVVCGAAALAGADGLVAIRDAVLATFEHVDRLIYIRDELAEMVAAEDAIEEMERMAAEVSP